MANFVSNSGRTLVSGNVIKNTYISESYGRYLCDPLMNPYLIGILRVLISVDAGGISGTAV